MIKCSGAARLLSAASFNAFGISLLLLTTIACMAGCDAKPKDLTGKKNARASDTPIANETKGAAIYRTKCSFCHQLNGTGLKRLYPPLAGSERVLGDPREVAMIVLNGMQGPIMVKGEPYDNAMPGWRNFLPPADIAEVINHVRTSWGNNASPITAAFVDSLQRATASKTEPIEYGE